MRKLADSGSVILRRMFQADGLGARLRRGISWNVGGALITHGANLITNVVIANILGREIFGQYSIVQSTLLTFGGVAQAAGGITATKFLAEFRSRDKQRAGRLLGLCHTITFLTGTVATLAIFLSAPWLARVVLKSPFLARPLRIAAFVALLTVVNMFQVGALAGLETYRSFASASAIQGPLQLGFCALLAWRWGLDGAVTGLAVAALTRWLILHLTVRREARKQNIVSRISGIWEERSTLMQYVVPAALSGLTAAPALWYGNTVLVRANDGYSQMALFSAALNLRSVVMFLPILLNNVGFSLLNNHRREGEQLRYRRIFWSNLAGTLLAALSAALFVAIFGNYLLRMYGRTFVDARPVLLVLLGSAVLESAGMAFYVIVQSQEKIWVSLWGIVLPRDFSFAVAATLLAPRYGALGLAFSYVISAIIACAATLIAVRNIGLNPTSGRVSVSSVTSRVARSAPSTLRPDET